MKYDDILQVREKNISISDIINEDVLKRFNEEFEGYSVNPVQVIFSLEKEEIVEGRLILAHAKQEHTKDKICTFDVDEPQFLEKFIKSVKGD